MSFRSRKNGDKYPVNNKSGIPDDVYNRLVEQDRKRSASRKSSVDKFEQAAYDKQFYSAYWKINDTIDEEMAKDQTEEKLILAPVYFAMSELTEYLRLCMKERGWKEKDLRPLDKHSREQAKERLNIEMEEDAKHNHESDSL